MLEPAGEIFDTAPYGWPVAKGSALAESLRQAMEHLIQTGEYRTIATMWGVEKGMIDRSGDQRRDQIVHPGVASQGSRPIENHVLLMCGS